MSCKICGTEINYLCSLCYKTLCAACACPSVDCRGKKNLIKVEKPNDQAWLPKRNLIEFTPNHFQLWDFLCSKFFYAELYLIALAIQGQAKSIQVEFANTFVNYKLIELKTFIEESNQEFRQFTALELAIIKNNCDQIANQQNISAYIEKLKVARNDVMKSRIEMVKQSMVFASLKAADLDCKFWYALKIAYIRKLNETRLAKNHDLEDKLISYSEQLSYKNFSRDYMHLIRNKQRLNVNNWSLYESVNIFETLLQQTGINDLVQGFKNFKQDLFAQIIKPNNYIIKSLQVIDGKSITALKNSYEEHKKSLARMNKAKLFIFVCFAGFIMGLLYKLYTRSINLETSIISIMFVGGFVLTQLFKYQDPNPKIDDHFADKYDRELTAIQVRQAKFMKALPDNKIFALPEHKHADIANIIPPVNFSAAAVLSSAAMLPAEVSDQARLNHIRGMAQPRGIFWGHEAAPIAPQRIIFQCLGDSNERSISIGEFITFNNDIYGYFDEAALLEDWVEGIERFRAAFNNRNGRESLSINNVGTNGIKLLSADEQRRIQLQKNCVCLYKIKVAGPNRVVAEQVRARLSTSNEPVSLAVFRFYTRHDLS